VSSAPYWAHFKTSFREDLQYFFTDSLFSGVMSLGYIVIFLLLYNATGWTTFFGIFTWSMLGWYLIVGQTLIRSQGDLIGKLSKQVQTGEIVTFISKPYHYPLALFGKHFGSVANEFLGTFFILVPFGLIVIGSSPITAVSVMATIVLMLLAMTLDFVICLSLGLLAFWTEDAKPYYWIYGKLTFVLGGLLFPLELFPPAIQSVAKLLPPAFLIYYPARILVDFSWPLFFHALLGAILYSTLFGVIALLIYRRAIKEVQLNGG
jgi:ABC-2 type transport system permease protein